MCLLPQRKGQLTSLWYQRWWMHSPYMGHNVAYAIVTVMSPKRCAPLFHDIRLSRGIEASKPYSSYCQRVFISAAQATFSPPLPSPSQRAFPREAPPRQRNVTVLTWAFTGLGMIQRADNKDQALHPTHPPPLSWYSNPVPASLLAVPPWRVSRQTDAAQFVP